MKKIGNRKAFTLVELIVVIAVIGILSAVLIPTFSGAVASANKAAVQATADSYRKAYLSLSSTKGTKLKYVRTDVTTEPDPVTGEERPVHTSPIYHAPFGPEELSNFAGIETVNGLYLVIRSAEGEEDEDLSSVDLDMDLAGFIYLDNSRGYYSCFNAGADKFETRPLSGIYPGDTSSDPVHYKLVTLFFKEGEEQGVSYSTLPERWYPGA